MQKFSYHLPATIEDALAILGSCVGAKVLAGGMTLIPTMKQRLAAPERLVDLRGIDQLKGIRINNNCLVIGAMTCHADVAHSPMVQETIPVLALLAQGIGDPHVRNRGTIGGSIANSDPAADYPAAVLGLDATIHTSRRSIKADEFFVGLFATALDANEIITAISFKRPDRACYVKFVQLASRFALTGVMVARFGKKVRVAVTGAGPCVFRCAELEDALCHSFAPPSIESIKISPKGLLSDIHGSAVYRAHLVTVMARRAVAACNSQ